jgi:predicted transcriptional regulator
MEPVHDAVFARLKADVLEGLAEADAGVLLSPEEVWGSIRAHQRAVEGKIIVDPQVKPRYALANLMAQCDLNAPQAAEDEAWFNDIAVGEEH